MMEIRTESYIAKVVMFNVMNSYEKCKEAVALYRKACEQHKTGKITLETDNEIRLWDKMLNAYQPKTTEQKVHNAMRNYADMVLNDIEELEYLEWERYAE